MHGPNYRIRISVHFNIVNQPRALCTDDPRFTDRPVFAFTISRTIQPSKLRKIGSPLGNQTRNYKSGDNECNRNSSVLGEVTVEKKKI